MVKGLLGKKVGMTRIFTEDGRWIPVTLIETGPCNVVQRKTQETDGYEAVQLGFGEKRIKNVSKPLQGHYKKAGVAPRRILQEFPLAAGSEVKPGDEVRADIFTVGDKVDITGASKGKGFAGVIKRHGFGGGPGGHGSTFHRAPGSIGQCATPSKVYKGKKLPGRMGHGRITIQNLEVVRVEAEKNVLLVRGSVPGANGTVVTVRPSVKGTK
jgi:large subunit ribosomal protein L3